VIRLWHLLLRNFEDKRPTVDPVPFTCGDCGSEPYFFLPLDEWSELRAALARNDHYEKHDRAQRETGSPALVGPLHGGMGCIA
jgi:hypothetical protein